MTPSATARSEAEWVNWQAMAPKMSGMPPRFLCALSVTQRAVLGFPVPGNSYWTADTIEAVGRRYMDMDMTPYKLALMADARL